MNLCSIYYTLSFGIFRSCNKIENGTGLDKRQNSVSERNFASRAYGNSEEETLQTTMTIIKFHSAADVRASYF